MSRFEYSLRREDYFLLGANTCPEKAKLLVSNVGEEPQAWRKFIVRRDCISASAARDTLARGIVRQCFASLRNKSWQVNRKEFHCQNHEFVSTVKSRR